MVKASKIGKALGLAIGVAGLTILITFLCLRRFNYVSLCSVCGAERFTSEQQFFFWRYGIYAKSYEHETPLSRVLFANGIVHAHPHNWLFEYGRGNGVFCALGDGHQIRSAVDSDGAVQFVLKLHQLGETHFRDSVVRGLLNPEASRFFFDLAVESEVKRLNHDTEWHEWVLEKGKSLDKELAEALKN